MFEMGRKNASDISMWTLKKDIIFKSLKKKILNGIFMLNIEEKKNFYIKDKKIYKICRITLRNRQFQNIMRIRIKIYVYKFKILFFSKK